MNESQCPLCPITPESKLPTTNVQLSQWFQTPTVSAQQSNDPTMTNNYAANCQWPTLTNNDNDQQRQTMTNCQRSMTNIQLPISNAHPISYFFGPAS
jgi:hypothetical protein